MTNDKWNITSDIWQITYDNWHMTWELMYNKWYMIRDVWEIINKQPVLCFLFILGWTFTERFTLIFIEYSLFPWWVFICTIQLIALHILISYGRLIIYVTCWLKIVPVYWDDTSYFRYIHFIISSFHTFNKSCIFSPILRTFFYVYSFYTLFLKFQWINLIPNYVSGRYSKYTFSAAVSSLFYQRKPNLPNKVNVQTVRTWNSLIYFCYQSIFVSWFIILMDDDIFSLQFRSGPMYFFLEPVKNMCIKFIGYCFSLLKVIN